MADNNNKPILQLLGITIIKAKGSEIIALGDDAPLADFVIDASGFIRDICDWADDIQPDTIYFFASFDYADNLLKFEVDGAGLNEVLDKVSLMPILDKVELKSYNDHSILPNTSRLLIEMTYRCGRGWEGDYDCDLDVKLVGYMDNQFGLHSLL